MRKKSRTAVFQTPLGWAGVALTDQGIGTIVLPMKHPRDAVRWLHRAEAERQRSVSGPAASLRDLQRAVDLLLRYFSGTSGRIDLPLDLKGYSDFQRSVWRATRTIPYGETRSYGWIAKRIGKPKAARAVGQALGANPVPVMVP